MSSLDWSDDADCLLHWGHRVDEEAIDASLGWDPDSG